MAIAKSKQTKRSLDALETKKNIFDTAILLFSKYGYDRVTVDDITKRAKVSKGTFYIHFPTKDAVLVEQFRQIDDYYLQVFRDTLHDGSTAAQKLEVLVQAMCTYCSKVCGLNVMKVVYMNQIGLGEREVILPNHDEARPFYTLIGDIVQQGYQSGEFVKVTSEDILVELIARNLRGLIYDWCLYDGAEDLVGMGQTACGVLIQWLTGRPSVQK